MTNNQLVVQNSGLMECDENLVQGQEQNRNENLLTEVPHEAVWLSNFISTQTKRNYKNSVKCFVGFHKITSADELRIIDQGHLIAWRDWLIAKGASSKTVTNRLSAISSLFKHLCDKQVARLNPVTGVRRPKVEVDRVKTPVITPEQVRLMLDSPDVLTLQGCRDHGVLSILFYTGCRVSEVCRLKVKDFYEDAGYFVLDFIVKGGKRNKIAIHPELQNSIKRYLEKSGHEEERDSPLLLPLQLAEKRKHIDTRQMNNIFHKHAEKVKLPKGVTPHSTRATFITQALERKCPIEAVQRSVGHSKIATTQMYDKRITRHRESASFAVVY
jgi:site-specific recombinase XerD